MATPLHLTGQDDDVVAAFAQGRDERAPDEARSTRDNDAHID
jgi:hypothetical protein